MSLGVRAHSIRSVASLQVLFRDVSLEDIYVVANWSSLHAFVKFYNLDLVLASGSQVFLFKSLQFPC